MKNNTVKEYIIAFSRLILAIDFIFFLLVCLSSL